MADESPKDTSADEQKLLLYALSELLINNGIVDAQEFTEAVAKWRKTLGIKTDVKPLAFLSARAPVTPTSDSKQGFDEQRKTVMVVDDVSHIRSMIKSALVMNGYHVVAEADDGSKAVDLYTRLKPDYILMDIEMKGMNGLDALRQIRSFDKNVPVIMMTGNPEKEYLIEAVNYGMADFIVKPVDVNRLMEVMKKFQS